MVDPRQEAAERLAGVDARVLEPSPPAVDEPPWFADDPVHRAGPGTGPVVAPVPGLGYTWDEVARGDADLEAWCADRWLGAWRRLPPVPDGFVAERVRVHRRAEEMAEARKAATGKIGLRYVRGGFGTPFFADDEQLRVDAPFLGDLFGFGASVLEELRVRWAAVDDTRVQLWPEHFDLSIDTAPAIGGASTGANRATYGVSPGDDDHPDPYLYVAPWEPQTGPLWSDTAFGGASLAYADLLAAEDQRATALAFFQRAWDELSAPR
jgi:hypothetical protein